MFVVFNIYDSTFYNGRLDREFNLSANDGETPWFFQPDDMVPHPESDWYGTISHSLSKTLMPYSTGFATAQEAKAAAHRWAIHRFGREVEVTIKGEQYA